LLWILLIALGALSAVAAWWLLRRPGPVPLEPGWAARVLTIAGDGIPGSRDGDLDRAQFSDPFGVAVAADRTIYVADTGDLHRIRRVTDTAVFTLAGGPRGFADGQGAAARFDTPSGLAIDRQGVLYLADTGNNAIRRITPDGQVSTLAGDGTAGRLDGPGQQARFNGPVAVAVDRDGRILVADTYNDAIRAINPDGVVTTVAGGHGPGLVDGDPSAAWFHTPTGIAADDAGNIYVADMGSGQVRRILPSGTVTTLVPPSDGSPKPIAVAVTPDGDLYVTDEQGTILEFPSEGASRVVAGSTAGYRDGPGSESRFRRPAGIAVAAPGRLVVADAGNSLLRLVGAASRLERRLPASPLIAPRFDVESFARQPLLWPVAPMEGPHEVAGTMGEARGGTGEERFHAGIDVRVDESTRVVAVRDGTVTSPLATGAFGTLNEWLRIGPLTYVHIRAGRTRTGEMLDEHRFVATMDDSGRIAGVRVKRGARFRTGEPIATVNAFNHVHLNVGWPGEEHNPLGLRLTQFRDTIPPTIARGGVRLYDEEGQLLSTRQGRRLLVFGRVHVVVDAWDRADGNRPGRRLGVYALGYEVLDRSGRRIDGFDGPADTIRFDQLASSPEAARLVYAPGSGIPFYGRRVTRFLYSVTNLVRDGVVAEGAWDTTLLAPGDYTLRVWARDIAGNAATGKVEVAVR
jgi:sugar lactone lactonase YvrE